MKNLVSICYCLLIFLFSCTGNKPPVILIPANSGKIEHLAAKEIRKYIYLRTNVLPEIVVGGQTIPPINSIILSVDTQLESQEIKLKTGVESGFRSLKISGGSAQALLYGAYEFAEQLGIRFYLHGDVIPDKKISFSIPDLDIRKKPLFVTRGILPFHDFPEGPDWWNEDDYKAVIAQLPKLKMNFIGFHTYPWRTGFNGEGQKSEPIVWIGKDDQVNRDGTVKSAYPVLHFHTADSTWGYMAAKTSAFLRGGSQLFETDNYGADYMKGLSAWPHTEEENIAIFNRTGKMFSSAFSMAKELGVKVCIGTESPLIIPPPVMNRIGVEKPTNEDIKALYKGIFSRIVKTYPIDYYWLWTPEGWTWSRVDDKVISETEADMQIAHESLNELGNPFILATCGWVLGPPKDRTEFDRILPKDMPFSCINRGLGYTPVDKGFKGVTGRSKWSIPWMEDDPALLTSQLWAGRMRKDAVDSWKYGCDGLFGIHWRTRMIAPTVSALAKAAWECDKYDRESVNRDLPVGDFYTDWVFSEFGIADSTLVRIFTNIDGKGSESGEGNKGDAYLNASDWIRGPGGLMVNRDLKDLDERISRYRFLSDMERIRDKVTGSGNLERYDYWLNAFRFNKAALEVAKSKVELNSIVDLIKQEKVPEKKIDIARKEALPKRIELSRNWEALISTLLSFVSTNGELGTLANLEMHNQRMNGNLTGHDAFLKSVLNSDLPPEVQLTRDFKGLSRIIVTTNRTILDKGENYCLRIRVLSEYENILGKFFYRPLGTKTYSEADFVNIGSHVFEVKINAEKIPDDFEYYIEVSDGKGEILYPASGEKINNSVIVL